MSVAEGKMFRRQVKNDHGEQGNVVWAVEQATACGYLPPGSSLDAVSDELKEMSNKAGWKFLASDGSKLMVYHSGKVTVGGPPALIPQTIQRILGWTIASVTPPVNKKASKRKRL